MKDLKINFSIDTGETLIRLDGVIEKLERILELRKELATLGDKEPQTFTWVTSNDGSTTITSSTR